MIGDITIAPKISEDNAVKVLEKIMERYQITNLIKERANLFATKIMNGTMSLEKEGIRYELFHSIKVGGEPRKTFTLQFPDAKLFKDNGINLDDFRKIELGEPVPGLLEKLSCIMLGIPSEYGDSIPLKDNGMLFQIGCTFFLAN